MVTFLVSHNNISSGRETEHVMLHDEEAYPGKVSRYTTKRFGSV